MKAFSYMVGENDAFVGVMIEGKTTSFTKFDFSDEPFLFRKTIPSVMANVWDYSKQSETIACLSWEEEKVTLFSAVDGIKRLSFSVGGGTVVKLFQDCIRVCGDGICVFDYSGRKIVKHDLRGSFVCDLGRRIITSRGKIVVLLDFAGKEIASWKAEGLGITSCAASADYIAVAESRGPITMRNRNGELVWRSSSPEGYHPIHVGCGTNGEVFAIHGNLASMETSVVTRYEIDGVIKWEQAIDKCPAVAVFFDSIPGWVCGDLEILEVGSQLRRRFHPGSVVLGNGHQAQ